MELECSISQICLQNGDPGWIRVTLADRRVDKHRNCLCDSCRVYDPSSHREGNLWSQASGWECSTWDFASTKLFQQVILEEIMDHLTPFQIRACYCLTILRWKLGTKASFTVRLWSWDQAASKRRTTRECVCMFTLFTRGPGQRTEVARPHANTTKPCCCLGFELGHELWIFGSWINLLTRDV